MRADTGPPRSLSAASDWQVPAYDSAVYAGRRHRHALVIPVINEGERIRRQLLRIRDVGLPVDVIVADGGSTDGSLDPAFLAEAGVRAVLSKTGPGKLSAQLRVAYAWCLQEGYAGIVTIDGNGKDGVEAIALMVAQLDAGCDYVQGSRYLPGGAAENTPRERIIANRVIHAPLLSLAGRYWFTDTTNGFRAYSARYLLDPRVRPFRDVFQRYSLPFYLTVRAGQIGLKVGQVPVERRYPANEAVPTKIGGLGAKLRLLGEALSAATGGYAPDTEAMPVPRWTWPIIVTVLVLLPFFLGSVVAPPFSPDSWAYYELAGTVFSDFYRFAHYRTYWNSSEYSASFPPLYPVAIAVLDRLADTGARSGFYLAFLSFAAFSLVSERIGRKVTGTAWLGLSMALVLLLAPPMILSELTGGRSIPLQLLLYATILTGLLCSQRIDMRAGVALGVLSGVAVLNRFDAVLLPFLVTGTIWWLTGRPSPALAALAAAAITASPWVAYSLDTFGRPFATDNTGVALSIDPAAYVTDWWPLPSRTVFDEPAAWLVRIVGNLGGFAASLASVATSGAMVAAFALALAVVYGVQRLERHGWVERSEGASSQHPPVLALFALTMFALLLPQLLTGYFDVRYFSALSWAAFMLIAAHLVLNGRTSRQRQVYANMVALIVGLSVLAGSVVFLFHSANKGRLDSRNWAAFEQPADIAALKKCIGEDANARILVVGDDTFAARAGAQGELQTKFEPRNMREGRLAPDGIRTFAANWAVDFVLIRHPAQGEHLRKSLDLRPVAGCSELYRVARSDER